MYQAPIDWEWGVVFAMVLVLFVYVEVWKVVRKPLYKRLGWWQEHNSEHSNVQG